MYATDVRVTFQKIIFNLSFGSSLFLKSLGNILIIYFPTLRRFDLLFSKLVPIFFQSLFLAKSLSDLKGKSDGFHFPFSHSSPFFSPESLTEMLDLTSRPVDR